MNSFDDLLMRVLDNPLWVVGGAVLLFLLAVAVLFQSTVLFFFKFTAKSLFRNRLRTSLVSGAIFVLVMIVTMVWSVLDFLARVTEEKSKDFKAIVTEKWQIPSQMPFSYADELSRGAARPGEKGDYEVPKEDSMTWQFYGGTIDPEKRTRENMIFFFAMDPDKVLSMMDGLDKLEGSDREHLKALFEEMKNNKRKVVVGKTRLEALNKQVGDWITVTSMNYKDIDLEVEIIGTFPIAQYDQSAIMNRQYLRDALDVYEREHGKKHPLAEKTLNLVWLRVPDNETYSKVAGQIQDAPYFTSPAVKVQTASSGVASFLDAYRDLFWAIRYLVVPAILATMALIIAIAITLSVRERTKEMAVLKVLGFAPWQILFLVLGEALLIGIGSGVVSAFCTWFCVNHVFEGLRIQIAFFPAFGVPFGKSLGWGFALGASTALVGSFVPAWSARSVRVAEVFAKVT